MKSRTSLAMLLFLLNEAVLFSMLIAAFVYFHGTLAPRSGLAEVELGPAGIYTFCLWGSAFAIWRASGSGERVWLITTLALGGIFLYGLGSQQWLLLHHSVTMSVHPFIAAFFALTGIHALHVLVGLVLLSAVSFGGAGLRPALHSIALYWYFVAAVWVVTFGLIHFWMFGSLFGIML